MLFMMTATSLSAQWLANLTPHGFSKKTRLAGEYLAQGFQFFRIAREQCSDIFKVCSEEGQQRIALHGLTDLAEIEVLCANDHNVKLARIIYSSSKLDKYSGIPVYYVSAKIKRSILWCL